MYCKNCSAKISDNAKSCPKCGDVVKGEAGSGILAVGYFLAFIIPILGIIIGIYSMAKSKPGHGIAMIAIAIFSTFFWMGFMNGTM